MQHWRATYHLHVTVGAGDYGASARVTRTRWDGSRPTVSGHVAKVTLGELRIDPATPLEQAIACVEAALAALIVEREQGTPHSYDL